MPDEAKQVPTPAKPRRRSTRLAADDFQPFSIIQEALKTRKAPDTLYHYTGTAGLVGILESETLRLTHVSFLNDRSEMVYARELIANVVRERRESTDDLRAIDFLSKAEGLVAGMLQGIDLYVSCFCEDGRFAEPVARILQGRRHVFNGLLVGVTAYARIGGCRSIFAVPSRL